MVIRPDADTQFGGDRVQMIETAKRLRNLGVDVIEKVGATTPTDYEGVDIVHLFNLQTRLFSLDEAKKAKAACKRLALSTIWWEPSLELILETSRKWAMASRAIGRKRAIEIIAGKAEPILAPDRALQSEVVGMADVLLPNSWAEAKELRKLDAHDRVVVVPNGVDVDHYDGNRDLPRPDWVPKGDYVLCAARIERLKGQLGLARAARRYGVPCVLVGEVVDAEYAGRCRSVGATTPGKKDRDELAAAYKNALLYVQPSLRETPGLASMEAAAMGCPVVTTKHGSTREYFGSWATYVDPFDYQSISREFAAALRRPRGIGLSEHIRRTYPWERAAEATNTAYERLVKD